MALWSLPFILIAANTFGRNLEAICEYIAEPWQSERSVVRDPALLNDFSLAVDDTLAVIGHGIHIDGIKVQRLSRQSWARYNWRDNRIEIHALLDYDEEFLLETAAHECVHALFTQARLDIDNRQYPEYWLQVEETTAYVLGAYIAGGVLTRRGRDGAALTDKLLNQHRATCDAKNPDGRRHWIEEMKRNKNTEIPPQYLLSAEQHFAPLELVNGVNKICKSNSDPWIAAHRIAQKYLHWQDR